MVEKVKDISFTIKCVQVFCKHKDLPFSLTECFVKKVLESFYGECTPINYISGSAKKQYPYRFEEALSAQFQIRSRKELLSQCLLKPPILFLIKFWKHYSI